MLSNRMRKRAAVNIPIGGQRLYAWIEEVAALEARVQRLEAKMTVVECAECRKTMLDCRCDDA